MEDSHLRNIPEKLFLNLSADSAKEVVNSLFLFIALAAILFSRAHGLNTFGRQSPTEHSCMIILKLMRWLRRRSLLKVFYFYLWQPSRSTESNGLSNFGRQSPKEYSCIIISKSIHWLKRRCLLKVFSIFSSGSQLVQQSETVRAILEDSHLRNIPEKLFHNLSTDLAEEVVKSFLLFIALAAILFDGAELF